MTFFSSSTQEVTAMEQRTMSHGVILRRALMKLPADKALLPDITATVSHIVDTEWLLSEDAHGAEGAEEGSGRRVEKELLARSCEATASQPPSLCLNQTC